MEFKINNKFSAPFPDSKYFCVLWFKKGLRGVQQKFFSGLEIEDAFEFAQDLMLDDDIHGVKILEELMYYFKERNIKS